MINAKLQNIIDTKSAIGNAIVNKGGTITGETPFFNYAAQIDGISTGTPQTIFAASDGSKWSRTNAVNLTNVSNNVTSDFNYWQPANNSTSDPILNVGTVGANISGNIRLVPVNQVNIAQYGNIVAQDNNGAKYVGFNGYDFVTNPTPTGNTTFNRWLLNNSATGTVIFANTTITNGGTYNGPNTSSIPSESIIPFVGNTASYGGAIFSVATNNGFIYVGGQTNQRVQKFHESNLAFVGNTVDYGGIIFSVTTNNGFIYVGGTSNQTVKKFYESNLAFVSNSNDYGGDIYSIKVNNGFVYASGGFGTSGNVVKKYHESNLVFVGNTASYGGFINSITINNGFIYVGGANSSDSVANARIRKYGESNLAFVGNTANYGGTIWTITTNNGFIYAGGDTNRTIQKFGESNLTRVGNTASYGATIQSIATSNGFIYVGGFTQSGVNRGVSKFYESNLSFVGNTVNYGGDIFSVGTNNGFIYVSGGTNQTVQKFSNSGEEIIPDNQTYYTITKIKE
jgi:hypothetical protein